jgi:hypothetical protein
LEFPKKAVQNWDFPRDFGGFLHRLPVAFQSVLVEVANAIWSEIGVEEAIANSL